MSLADRERWNRKYAAGNPNAAFAPDRLLLEHAHLLPGGGMALDVACGVAHNAMYLARRGYEVVAVDASLAGLRHARAALAAEPLPVHLVAADLEQLALPADCFDVVIVFRFLDRALVPRLKTALAPGGLLIYETFNTNRPGMNPAYLLRPGELAAMYADFETVETNDTADNRSERSWWIGRRPA
jgi:SAM-dependent methyltransferase